VGKNDAASIIRRWIELPMVEHLYGAKTLWKRLLALTITHNEAYRVADETS
jgi:hypothetical protein